MRVARAFAFVDLSNFTSFTDTHGDEQAGQVLADFRFAVRDVASRRGVRVAKWLGDGAMLVGVEAGPLVAAVLEMEERVDRGSHPLKLRAGITQGRVILFEGDDYIGSAVNLAARLSDRAGPHEIVAQPTLAPVVPPWAEWEKVGPVEIRGFHKPIPLIRLRRRECDGQKRTDPVCGMELDDAGAVSTRETVDGQVIFCSDSCADAWDDRTARPSTR
ncbi:MAG: hypothetical protein ACR2H3_17555 [Acidimicrobiales bacterium]